MKKDRKKGLWSRLALGSLVLLASAALLLAGCGQKPGGGDSGTKNQDTQQKEPAANGGSGEQKPDISAKPAETRQTVTLYFGDDQAMYLVPEQREVNKGDETLEAVIIRELIEGPQKDGLSRTMPEGTRLLSVSVVNGVAFVNFSQEFKTRHWGGSAGETMTIYSVVSTLGKLPGIEKVQFLLEGEKHESILGHFTTIEPIAPDWNLVEN